MADQQTEQKVITVRGRLINESLFVKDKYDEKAVPKYRVELAIPDDDPSLEKIEDALLDFADDLWGDGAGDDEDLVLPLKDGNALKKRREKKGKDGEAYADMTVIRADTIYNKDGIDGPGGIQVFDQDVEPIDAARKGEIYPGCYIEAALAIGGYENNEGFNALKFYLQAVQKVAEGEKLVKASDRSSLFKPVARSDEEGSKGRRRRRRG